MPKLELKTRSGLSCASRRARPMIFHRSILVTLRLLRLVLTGCAGLSRGAGSGELRANGKNFHRGASAVWRRLRRFPAALSRLKMPWHQSLMSCTVFPLHKNGENGRKRCRTEYALGWDAVAVAPRIAAAGQDAGLRIDGNALHAAHLHRPVGPCRDVVTALAQLGLHI